ncbi:hypothetical protein NC653_031852 [Populus alba x Populus x berolinensis]|uniref:CTLH domain-containing protein n=1 Tax=Populus alba x Populus x berolinensis TaxID=444605 RepID=A0AAD6Q224_9ROSI|nr:hypothetical protein NC653_031852 [Populus alba x Populus x berolinensis]
MEIINLLKLALVFRISSLTYFAGSVYKKLRIRAGEWDEIERYLCGFTKVEDNRYSMKIFFEIRKQKYLEALDRQDRAKAVEILVKDLKVFASFNEELFKEITQLLTLDNFRQNEQLSKYGDTKSARNIMLVELKKLIEANPLFRDKLTFPPFKSSRLRTLINQSLNWQHQLCKNPRSNPDIKTLFIDHSCTPTTANGAHPPPPSNTPLVGPIPKAGAFPPIGAHGPFQPVVSPTPGAIAGWMSANNPSLPHPSVAAGPPTLVQPSSAAAFLKHPRTPTGMNYQSADSEHLMKRMRPGQSEEVSFSGIAHTPNIYSQDDLPKTVVRTLNQGSNVISMDFHPQHQTILLGVAFSKHIVQIYTYNPTGELRPHLEIDAHVGGVNDIAFAHPNKQLCIVTCGDDKMIKFIFSTAIDGKIKAWLYDSLGSRVDYDAPGLWCTMMAYSADGTRLFSCGTSKEGESHLVEWNESEGSIKRTYLGFRKRSLDVVQFDTTRSHFLAAGDEFQIKFWDMDNTNMLTAVDADGGLPASPRLRFNKEGSLLAVTTSDNGIKILASSDGLRLIRMLESRAIDKSRSPSEPINSKGTMDNSRLVDLKALRLPDSIAAGKATASNAPQLWQPPSGTPMTNDINESKPAEESAACIALSKNDSYVMSASGGKVMTTFMSPPPAATFLAFHPQDNNIIAIGMEDSTVQIYNVRVDEVKTKLKGHQNRITGLAFSQSLNVLVSSGADAQWSPKDTLAAPISSAIYSSDGGGSTCV